ncbi:MAG: serine/threonine-protein kinase [Bacteroidota bacterium]
MDAARWATIKPLLDGALDRAAGERTAFLADACTDPALRAEVQALAAAHDTAGTFLNSPLLGEGGDPRLDKDAPLPETIGPYRVLRLLGRGGMGEVFLAERADGLFERRVALKRVRAGLDAPALARRFDAERRILATLQHPGIAQLFDAGTDAEGRPYFAMEVAEGTPLTDYARTHALSADARLDLFRQACDAVHHAHQRLVVHRDLKPSNVFVTEDDAGQPQVKLLDFGIAKLLGENTERTLLTETGLRPMTRSYAAPEQLRGDEATTATDVYALGVLLYELLTGQRPFEAPTAGQLEAAILADEPTKPSTALRHAGPEASPGALTPERLRGDLDTVVLCALAKDPAARYNSAAALAEDVRRHQDSLPITARPPSVGYRMQRFAGRHRIGVAITAAVLAAAVLFTLYHTQRLAAERDQARRAADRAEQVSGFLTGLFKGADPTVAVGDTLTARALLDQGRQRMETALQDQPLLRADLLRVLGEVHVHLGLFDEAAALLTQSDSLGRGSSAADPTGRVQTLTALGTTTYHQGDLDAAATYFEEAVQIGETARLSGSVPTEALGRLGLNRYHQGQYDEADSLARHILATFQPASREDSVVFGEAHRTLGLARSAMSDLAAAAEAYRASRSITLALFGPQHPDVATATNNLAGILRRQGRLEEAEQHYREALDVRRRVFGEAHPLVAQSVNNFGVFLFTQGRYPEAEATLREAVDLNRARLGDDHPEVALGLSSVAGMRRRQGDPTEALRLYDEALAIQRARLGGDHPHLGRTLNSSAQTAQETGDLDRAARHFAEAIRIFQGSYGPGHERTVRAHVGLGQTYRTQGRAAAARRAFADAQDALAPDADSTLRAFVLAESE